MEFRTPTLGDRILVAAPDEDEGYTAWIVGMEPLEFPTRPYFVWVGTMTEDEQGNVSYEYFNND